jgi:hypothetical protein
MASELQIRDHVRAMVLILVASTGCGHDSLVMDSDMAMCLNQAPRSPTACGPQLCAAGQICMIEHPGACPEIDMTPPPDGGGSGSPGPGECIQYTCEPPPPNECDCNRACEHFSGGTPNHCSFDGATLNCVYI